VQPAGRGGGRVEERHGASFYGPSAGERATLFDLGRFRVRRRPAFPVPSAVFAVERGLLSALGMLQVRRAALAVVGAAACLVWPAALKAGDTALGLNLGIGSEVGFAGVTLTQSIMKRARLELGGGYGYSGYQLSLMPRLALGDGPVRFIAGAGVSVAFPTDPRVASGHPVWLNLDVAGGEYRFRSGVAISGNVGFTGGLGGGTLCFPEDGCEPQFLLPVTHFWGPEARVGVAYWF